MQYLSEWSDGVVQDGVSVTREFGFSVFESQNEWLGGLAVTLTVWNVAGASSTVTHRPFPDMGPDVGPAA